MRIPNMPYSFEHWIALVLKLDANGITRVGSERDEIIFHYNRHIDNDGNNIIKVTSEHIEVGEARRRRFCGEGLDSKYFEAYAEGFNRSYGPPSKIFHPFLRVYWELGRDTREAVKKEALARNGTLELTV